MRMSRSVSPCTMPPSIVIAADHIHLLVPDQAKGVAWYQKNFGPAGAKIELVQR